MSSSTSSSFSFYEGTVPHARGALKTLLELADKIEAHTKKASVPVESLLEAKLAEDMFPLTFQVNLVTDVTIKMVCRVMGEEPPAQLDWKEIKSLDEVRTRVNSALSRLEKIDVAKYNERATTDVTFGMGPGKSATTKAYGYANGYSIPNIYFHVMTAIDVHYS